MAGPLTVYLLPSGDSYGPAGALVHSSAVPMRPLWQVFLLVIDLTGTSVLQLWVPLLCGSASCRLSFCP